MPKLPELEVAKRAVQEGTLPQEVLEACLAEKRRARADGLDLTLRELLQEKGFLSAQAWADLEKRASTTDTRSDRSRPGNTPARSMPRSTAGGEADLGSSSRLVPSAEFLGEYRILKQIGRGAMGVVYEAIQGTLGRRVALKVLPAGAAMSPVARERFQREARAAASLTHPNIVPIYDQGEERGVPFFAMELVSGRTLKDVLLGEGPLDPSRAARLGAQAARALDYAHERGVIHRDVKPDNLFLEAPQSKTGKIAPQDLMGERVLLADFGLATRLDDASLTREGTAVGTPLYMAPEQARGERDRIDRRCDVYGLGATLYELLSGTPPFSGSPDTQTLLARIRDEEAAPLRMRIEKQRKAGIPKPPAEVPIALDAVVMRALEKMPERRYWTAGDMADDLERFLKGEPVAARPPGTLERAVRFARKQARLLAGVGALAVFALVAVVLGQPVQQRWRAGDLYVKAISAEQAGRRGEARALLEEALGLTPHLADARAKLATILVAEQDVRRARDEVERAIEDDPRCLEARLLRGDLLRRSGELDRAAEDFDAAAKEAEHDARPAYGRGAVLAARGRWAEAAKELGRGLDLAREARGRPGEVPAYREALRLCGEARFRSGDVAGAQPDLEESIRLEPDAFEPRVLLGRALVALGKDRLAEEAFSDALRRKPDDPEALELRAGSMRRLGRAIDALEALKGAANATRPRSRLVRGLIYSESVELPGTIPDFDYDRARGELEAALETGKTELEPAERVRALVALAWIDLGSGEGAGVVSSSVHPAKLGRAVERLDAALEVAPDDASVRLTRGLLLVRSTRPERARPDLEAALAHKELAYSATVGLAHLAVAQGKAAEGLALLARAADLDAGRPTAHALRARLLYERGDLPGARGERALAALRLGAESGPAASEPRARPPLDDVADPLEAAERAASRGKEAFDSTYRDVKGNFGVQAMHAAAWFRRALLLDPDRSTLASRLGDILYLLGLPTQAHSAYDEAGRLDPLLLESELGRAILERDFSNVDGGARIAADTLIRVVERASQPAPDGDPLLATRARYELARALEQAGDAEHALAQIELCCKEAPTRYTFFALRARLMARLHREGAREASRVAAQLLRMPGDPAGRSRSTLFCRAGAFREGQNDVKSAVHFFTRAIEADSSNADAWRLRGERLFRWQPFEFPAAFLDVATAAELDATMGITFHKEFENNVWRYQRVADEFADRVEETITLQPDHEGVQFLAGFWILVHEGAKNAQSHFDLAVELAPEWSLPYLYRAQTKLETGDLDGAAADLQAAHARFANDPYEVFLASGLALRRGDRDGAWTKLEEAVHKGFKWPDTLRHSPVLAPLQGTEAFDRLVQGLGAVEDEWLDYRIRKKRNAEQR
jgi:serine/threonine protein kinase/Tfp pilus assembly protein PilF